MNIIVDIQHASEQAEAIPSDALFTSWVKHALQSSYVQDAVSDKSQVELSIRVVDAAESQQLNFQYRQKDKPTNVLSFPAEVPDFVDVPLLGDLVICVPVVMEEAIQQQKEANAHWAHMTIHGTLHLLGYDHIGEEDALLMESIEVKLLTALGFPSPYENDEVNAAENGKETG